MAVRIKWPFAKLKVSQLEFPGDVVIMLPAAGAPTNAVTGANVAGPGSLYIDKTAGKLYTNTGTKASPTWVSVGSQT